MVNKTLAQFLKTLFLPIVHIFLVIDLGLVFRRPLVFLMCNFELHLRPNQGELLFFECKICLFVATNLAGECNLYLLVVPIGDIISLTVDLTFHFKFKIRKLL